MAYCSVVEVKEYLGITQADDDALFDTLIEGAQAIINRYTHRVFEASADTTRYFDYSSEFIDKHDLLLDADLCAITTVTNGDSTTVTSAQYTTLPKNETPYYAIRLLSDSGITWTYSDEWMDAISIAGKWAFSTTAPDDIRQACIRLASYLYRQKDASMYDVTVIEAGVIASPQGIPLDVRAMLKPYVRH